MADFASFKVKTGDAPQVINLDLVGEITTFDNDKTGVGAQCDIVFNRFFEPKFDAEGNKISWIKMGSRELMRWEFKAVSINDFKASDLKKIRDAVLKGLILKERTFVFEDLVKPGTTIPWDGDSVW